MYFNVQITILKCKKEDLFFIVKILFAFSHFKNGHFFEF